MVSEDEKQIQDLDKISSILDEKSRTDGRYSLDFEEVEKLINLSDEVFVRYHPGSESEDKNYLVPVDDTDTCGEVKGAKMYDLSDAAELLEATLSNPDRISQGDEEEYSELIDKYFEDIEPGELISVQARDGLETEMRLKFQRQLDTYKIEKRLGNSGSIVVEGKVKN